MGLLGQLRIQVGLLYQNKDQLALFGALKKGSFGPRRPCEGMGVVRMNKAGHPTTRRVQVRRWGSAFCIRTHNLYIFTQLGLSTWTLSAPDSSCCKCGNEPAQIAHGIHGHVDELPFEVSDMWRVNISNEHIAVGRP